MDITTANQWSLRFRGRRYLPSTQPVRNRCSVREISRKKLYHSLDKMKLRYWWRWRSLFHGRTVQVRTLSLVPLPTGPHPTRGDSGVCRCIHVCLVWSVFTTAFIVPHHLPVCRQLHTDIPAQFGSIWTWRNAHEVRRFFPNRGSNSGRQICSLVLYQLSYSFLK